MTVRILNESDAAAWWDIRLAGLEREPLAFGQAPEEHRALSVETIAARFRDTQSGNFTLGAFEDDQLIGIVTFVRASGMKERHKGHIYGIYVGSEHRGKRIGSALIAALIERARQDASLEQIVLMVASGQEAAKRLYRSFGFERYGVEPSAMKAGSTYVDHDCMILRIR